MRSGVIAQKMGMTRLFSEADIDVMKRLRSALNPRGLLTPGKMLPTAGACGMEQIHPGRRARGASGRGGDGDRPNWIDWGDRRG